MATDIRDAQLDRLIKDALDEMGFEITEDELIDVVLTRLSPALRELLVHKTAARVAQEYLDEKVAKGEATVDEFGQYTKAV